MTGRTSNPAKTSLVTHMLFWENGRPIVLHAEDGPAAFWTLVEAAGEFPYVRVPAVGKLPLGVVVVDEQPETAGKWLK